MRPPAKPAGSRNASSRGPVLFASVAFVAIVGLICALVYVWASDRGRAETQADLNREVTALQSLVSALAGPDGRAEAPLSPQDQATLEQALASEGGDQAAASESSDSDTYLWIAALTVLLWLAAAVVFSRSIRSLTSASRGRRSVVRAIRHGIERGEFELHYQPQIDLVTGRPIAVEALLRWRRGGALIPPGEFLGDAEASGVIGPLTDHVIELAFAQAAAWRAAGNELRVAVNLSAVNLRDFRIVDQLERLLDESDVPASAITFEVTETAVLDEPEQTRTVLDALADLGFPIAVDDFGTGYSSLLWLRLFPVTEVKIDRSFVASMLAEGEAYVSGVVRLGHDLELTVVAEGIEDRETLIGLQELGCDVGQGFLFAKPLPADEVERWLAATDPEQWATERKELAMPTDQVDLDAARRLIEKTAANLGFDDSAIWDMKCAATEALTNAIEHGAPSEDGRIHLRLGRDHGDMLLEVWGGGKASGAPHVDATHRGRGIAIMTALMDDVELRRSDGDTVVRLVKRLPAAAVP